MKIAYGNFVITKTIDDMKNLLRHLPNVLSASRIFAFPLAIWLIFNDRPNTWFILTLACLATDGLDGFLARKLNAITSVGAKLDSFGDMAMYISVISAVFTWKWELFKETPALMAVYLVSLGLTYLIAILKFRKVAALHLYSTKASGLMLTVFVIILFTMGFSLPLYIAAMGIGILASLEEVLVLFVLNTPDSDVGSLFFLSME